MNLLLDSAHVRLSLLIIENDVKYIPPQPQQERSELSAAKVAVDFATYRLKPFFTAESTWRRFFRIAEELKPDRGEGRAEFLRLLTSRIQPFHQKEIDTKAALATLSARQSDISDNVFKEAAMEPNLGPVDASAQNANAQTPFSSEVGGGPSTGTSALPPDGIDGPTEEVFSDPLPAFESDAMALLHELATAELGDSTDPAMRTGGPVIDGGIFASPIFPPQPAEASLASCEVDDYHDAVEDLEEDDDFQVVGRRNKRTLGGGRGKGEGSKPSGKNRGDGGGRKSKK